MHPSTEAILKFFDYDHLPPSLQEISEPFHRLAYLHASRLEGPELSAGLRKLLEAKDCMVRAALTKPKTSVAGHEPCHGCGSSPLEHPNDSGCQEWHHV